MMTQSTNKPKLGILLCGHSPEKVIEQFGPYDGLFKTLLGPDSFDYQTYPVVDGEFPASIDSADAWLITGSKHGAYEPHPWIAPLEEFIRSAFQAKKPMVGVCFGHQILAQALGGKVEKFSGGWIAGTFEYQFDAQTGMAPIVINAWHQDQVIDIPDGARTLGSSANCQHAIIAYGDHAVSMQPHPEFENDYVKLLMSERGWVLPDEVQKRAVASLDQNLTNQSVAQWFRDILSR